MEATALGGAGISSLAATHSVLRQQTTWPASCPRLAAPACARGRMTSSVQRPALSRRQQGVLWEQPGIRAPSGKSVLSCRASGQESGGQETASSSSASMRENGGTRLASSKAQLMTVMAISLGAGALLSAVVPEAAQAATHSLQGGEGQLHHLENVAVLGFLPGPLVDEFWDNMRRYVLYFFTVSTGGLYVILQPIIGLLRNPVSAVLVVAIASGTFYLSFLVLSAMLGTQEYSYQFSPYGS